MPIPSYDDAEENNERIYRPQRLRSWRVFRRISIRDDAMAEAAAAALVASMEARFSNLELIGRGSFGDVFKG